MSRWQAGPLWGAEVGSIAGMLCAGLSAALPAFRRGPIGVVACISEWLIWRDLVIAGQRFTAYGMDTDILEAGIGAGIYALGARGLAAWYWRWELLRLLVGAGAMKFLSFDESWRNLSAVHWHFQSTVLPGPLGWYAHWLTSHWPFLGHL